jgi:hypothetical protein
MSPPPDAVIIAVLEYETATLDALLLLKGTDGEAQRAACLRFARAVSKIDAMPTNDQVRGLTYLTARARIPADSWRLILAAMQTLVADWISSLSERPR